MNRCDENSILDSAMRHFQTVIADRIAEGDDVAAVHKIAAPWSTATLGADMRDGKQLFQLDVACITRLLARRDPARDRIA